MSGWLLQNERTAQHLSFPQGHISQTHTLTCKDRHKGNKEAEKDRSDFEENMTDKLSVSAGGTAA